MTNVANTNPKPVRMGRPAGECHLAILQAAHALRLERAQSEQGATLRELVHRSQVGYKVARALVPKLCKRGQLAIVGEQRVAYRNKPVSVYAPAVQEIDDDDGMESGNLSDLVRAMSMWVQRD